MEIVKNKGRWIWWTAGILLLAVYFLFDPLESSWMPQCMFHKITGYQCMGCGSQRMLHALLHGHISEAMHANMFLFFSLPLIAALVVLEFYRGKYPRLYRKIYSVWFIITATAILLAWLLIRNILGI